MSTLELFFDLVFVFTITQVMHLVTRAHGATDLFRAFLARGDPVDVRRVCLTHEQRRYGSHGSSPPSLGGFLVMALATPKVAERDGLAFGLAYLAVVAVHGSLFLSAPNSSARAMYRVSPFNITAAMLLVAAGLARAQWNLTLWIGALLVLLTTILARGDRGFQIRADHFAERHGLIILIALGESVAGLGVRAGDIPVSLPIIRAVLLGLALAAWDGYDVYVVTNASGGVTPV